MLGPGQTTPDGRLTLVVNVAGGNARVILLNNDVHPVMVESYRLDRGSRCSGKALELSSSESYSICSVPNGPDANAGRPSLQMSLTWYELRPSRPTPEPTAFFVAPSPTPSV